VTSRGGRNKRLERGAFFPEGTKALTIQSPLLERGSLAGGGGDGEPTGKLCKDAQGGRLEKTESESGQLTSEKKGRVKRKQTTGEPFLSGGIDGRETKRKFRAYWGSEPAGE